MRADVGFYSGGFFDLLEARDIEYAVAARMTKRLGRCLRGVRYRPVGACRHRLHDTLPHGAGAGSGSGEEAKNQFNLSKIPS